MKLTPDAEISMSFSIAKIYLEYDNSWEWSLYQYNSVKPVYNDHPRDPKFVTVVDRWSLFRGSFMKIEIGTPK